MSLVSLRNQLYLSGYWRTVRYLDNKIEGLIKFFPTVSRDSSLLGRVSFVGETFGFRYDRLHPSRQSPLVKGFVVSAKPPSDELEGAGALLKCMLKLGTPSDGDGENPFHWLEPGASVSGPLGITHDATLWTSLPQSDGKHLERSGRPQRVNIKLGWSSPV